MIKFKTRWINKINNKEPIMIVGICPGKQRKNKQNQLVFSGNRTGDFIEKILKNGTNIYLTNIFNYLIDKKITLEIVQNGLEELRDDILTLKPYRIIALGNFAYNYCKEITNISIIKLYHPSYILRFNKNKMEYIKKFNKLLNENKI